jgi:peptidoglycan/LPS O-acetylase OafA/YrhL
VVSYHRQLISVTQQIKLIVVALLYSTNWRLAFGWDPTLDPTAIIWSLSIEEQFYLVWPLLVIGALAFKLKRRFILTGLVLTVLAVMLHRYLLLDEAMPLTRLYYGTDTRADALLVGCLLALLPITTIHLRAQRWHNLAGVLSAAGLVYLIAVSAFGDRFLYRGGFTIVAVLAATLIFVAVNSPPRLLSVLLNSTPLRWLGRISYSLYLWHWLVVQNTTLWYLGYWEPWARLAIALGIASASFYLIERPFNRLKSRFGMTPTVPRTDSRSIPPRESSSPIEIALPNYESSITSG